MDFTTEYPVLAVKIKYSFTGNATIKPKKRGSQKINIWQLEKPIYAKDTLLNSPTVRSWEIYLQNQEKQ